MKAQQPDEEPAEQADETAGESDESSGRSRVVVLFVVGIVAAWRIVAAFPEVAYIVVGILGAVGWQKFTAWREGRDAEGQAEAEPPDVGEALRRLIRDDKGVLLTVLRDDLKLPDTKAVKALLEAAGIPWKPSRTREGNGPAVRREAIPPAPSPVADDSHGEGCCCRSGDNGNGNNADGEGPGEGIRVERTDSGYLIHDLGRRMAAEIGKIRPVKPNEGEGRGR
ncbi:hypothetical protein OHB41_21040 [Streptomyces sp. NBC_01571]|uniref:hypothetical protein n=1 Tax=Streptomyces sp. NBC_01571 TaxID=2975883 RepID=UPI002251D9EC|nr:hypothetical protein [Streptomyces sp. NBC_01571]MCX4575630.1 hypothetical protein [Streptomyces sp. NBC_01571]